MEHLVRYWNRLAPTRCGAAGRCRIRAKASPSPFVITPAGWGIELRFRGVAVQSPAPAGVITNGDGDPFAGLCIGQQRPHRVGAVVYSNNVQVFHYSLFSVQIVAKRKVKESKTPYLTLRIY